MKIKERKSILLNADEKEIKIEKEDELKEKKSVQIRLMNEVCVNIVYIFRYKCEREKNTEKKNGDDHLPLRTSI